MKRTTFINKKRQLRGLVKKLNVLIRTDGLAIQVEKIIIQIKELVRELRRLISATDLKKIVGSVAVLIGLSFPGTSTAQNFIAPVTNPFGLDSLDQYAFPHFTDLDNDGDLDVLVGEYYGGLQYFKNIGASTVPQFAPPVANPFGLVSGYYIAFPTSVDLDNDGDLDVLVGEYYGVMKYYENNTNFPFPPTFAAPQSNPFGLDSTYEWASPTFADLDNDGDQDLLVGEYYGSMQYFENVGSPTNPSFSAPQTNPFGLVSTYNWAFPDFADFDNDGDLDLIVGDGNGVLQYFENVGTPSSPQFSAPQPNPFGLTTTNYLSYPTVEDLDEDGDVDLLLGAYNGALLYFENTPATNIEEITIDVTLYPNPVSNILSIKTKEKIERVEIFNGLGQVVNVYHNIDREISLNDLEIGLYSLKITFANGNSVVRKIEKQ